MFKCRIFPISSRTGESPEEVEKKLNSLFEKLHRERKTPVIKATSTYVLVLWKEREEEEEEKTKRIEVVVREEYDYGSPAF